MKGINGKCYTFCKTTFSQRWTAMCMNHFSTNSCNDMTAREKGIKYEMQVVEVLKQYNCMISPTQSSLDGGIDHHGRWIFPDMDIRVITQCKNEVKSTGVTYLREFDGVLATQPHGTIGIFATSSGYSMYAKRFVNQMNHPLIRMTIVENDIIELDMNPLARRALPKLVPGTMTSPPFKLINSSSNVVDDMLQGLVSTSPKLALVPQYRVVLRRDYNEVKDSQVTLLSGGGSGHEPAHAGYIGDGMLTGVICGDVFASPSTKQVLSAIRLVAGQHGCLIIVKNYTGDRLNFGQAIEKAKAEGFQVDMIVVGDDLAIPGSNAGRRGLAGTVIYHKIAGAMAKQGHSLHEIATQLRELSVGTMGVAWKSCSLPGQSESRQIKSNEMELGLGIHGEPGVRTASQKSSKETVKEILDTIQGGLDVKNGDDVVLLVNNLGSTTSMELFVIANDAHQHLAHSQVHVERVSVGSFMTALDMSGISLTLWKLPIGKKEQLLSWLDLSVDASAWPSTLGRIAKDNIVVVEETQPQVIPSSSGVYNPKGLVLKEAIEAAAQRIIQAEPDLTLWDTQVGDGDCGHTLHSGASAVLKDLPTYPLNIASHTLHAIARSIENSIGGTSGVLYTIFFTAAGNSMHKYDKGEETVSVPYEAWVMALESAIAAIQKYGGAAEGSRTMIDALLPALRTAKKPTTSYSEWIQSVSQSALDGANATRKILPKDAFGRTSYVGEAFTRDVPDPGAMAVALWISAIVDVLKN